MHKRMRRQTVGPEAAPGWKNDAIAMHEIDKSCVVLHAVNRKRCACTLEVRRQSCSDLGAALQGPAATCRTDAMSHRRHSNSCITRNSTTMRLVVAGRNIVVHCVLFSICSGLRCCAQRFRGGPAAKTPALACQFAAEAPYNMCKGRDRFSWRAQKSPGATNNIIRIPW
jgi:hypothetical protein